MTNAEKYLKDGVDKTTICELARELYYYSIAETEKGYTPDKSMANFFTEKATPTLTADEKVILRNLPKDADSIGRDSDGELEIKMINQNNCNDFGYDWFGWYDKLFQFIQPRRRI